MSKKKTVKAASVRKIEKPRKTQRARTLPKPPTPQNDPRHSHHTTGLGMSHTELIDKVEELLARVERLEIWTKYPPQDSVVFKMSCRLREMEQKFSELEILAHGTLQDVTALQAKLRTFAGRGPTPTRKS